MYTCIIVLLITCDKKQNVHGHVYSLNTSLGFFFLSFFLFLSLSHTHSPCFHSSFLQVASIASTSFFTLSLSPLLSFIFFCIHCFYIFLYFLTLLTFSLAFIHLSCIYLFIILTSFHSSFLHQFIHLFYIHSIILLASNIHLSFLLYPFNYPSCIQYSFIFLASIHSSSCIHSFIFLASIHLSFIHLLG